MAIRDFFNAVIEYETPRYVKVHNPLVGLVLRSSQCLIISYIVGWALIHERGYQESAPVESSFITKVKGTTSSRIESEHSGPAELYNRVWDEADYVVPPAENGAFFITTNVLITPNQTQDVCVENYLVKGASCNVTDNHCIKGQYLKKGHGIMTGSCVPDQTGEYFCQISAWCPVENDEKLSRSTPVLNNTEKFTVYIKNSVAFPYFGMEYRKNNIEGNNSRPSFYHPEKNPLGQIFNIGEIVALAGGNYSSLAINGGVIGISITWNCDLDWDFDKYCKPRYSFSVLEDSGWNFRHAYYHEMNRRTLLKAYGIKFIITVDGLARKFSLKNTVLNVGNGLALLGITTVLCEFVLMYFIKEKNSVAKKKYDYVFAPPIFPPLLAAAATPRDPPPPPINTERSQVSQEDKNDFGTQTFTISD